LSLAGCGSPEAEAPPEPRLVRTFVVDGGAGANAAEYTGEILSRHETELSFQVGGKVVGRPVDVGSVVKRGDVLAQLDDTDLRLRVQASRSGVDAANAELERARSEEARYRDLLERGLTTRAAYLTQQTAVKTNQSRLEQATADLLLSEQRLGYATLRADVAGVVTRVDAEVGTVVASGQRVLAVAQPHELDAVFDVPDARIDGVRHAATVELRLHGGAAEGYTASVREISPRADDLTRTYQVRASIEGPPPTLRLGMSVIVTVPQNGSAGSVVVPATALFQNGDKPAVWIVRSDRTLELRGVAVERYESDAVVISAGLASGERVVTAGVHRLAENESVRLMAEAGR
jgi:RND family efflux transporter MFP subunit